MNNDNIEYKSYFENRCISEDCYKGSRIPEYIQKILPADKNSAILDLGCGYGQFMSQLKEQGYTHVKGIDISEKAVNSCLSRGLNAEIINDLVEYLKKKKNGYDFIFMSHVLEHLPKEKTIETLRFIREALAENGKFCVLVPNAQSNTDCYWAYEDFTHYTLFTAGSLFYVLKSAGFSDIQFLDPKGVENSSLLKKIFKLFFLKIYSLNKKFWNIITSSSYHGPSPVIYTFDIKARANK